jgi:hypothetical protein
MLDCIFNVLYLRSYWPNSWLLMRRSKTNQICFKKRTSTIPSLSASSRRIHRHGSFASLCAGCDLPFRRKPVLTGWRLPRRRRERGCEPQSPVSEGQPSDASHSQSGLPMPHLALRKASSRFSIAGMCRAWGKSKPSECLPSGFAA